jgi:hypothetical protein
MNHNTASNDLIKRKAINGNAVNTRVSVALTVACPVPAMGPSKPYWPPTYADKRYIICPLCGQKVPYVRRATHGCFKSHLSEIARNVQQMNRE